MAVVSIRIPADRDKCGVVFTFIVELLLCASLLFSSLLYANGEEDRRLITDENLIESDFQYGCRIGDLAMVQRCVQTPGFYVNALQKIGISGSGVAGLTVAAGHGHLNIVKALVSAGADVNIRSTDFKEPIYYAVQNGHCQVVDFLIQQQEIQLDKDADEKPLLVIATENEHTDVVKVLASEAAAEAGIDINKAWKGRSALGISLVNNYSEITSILLLAPDIDLNAACYDGTTPVIIAAGRADLPLFNALGMAGANLLAPADGIVMSVTAELVARHVRPFSLFGKCRDREKRANCTGIIDTCRAIRQGNQSASSPIRIVKTRSGRLQRLPPAVALVPETKL